ncbi:MAG: phosphocholine cytidylyltransferase family protein [Magnetococcus sp. DMHC-8]
MKAIILAAGRGSRMQHLTDELPKCLVPLRGKPLLEWQLTALRAAGVTEIAIVTGYRREQLADRGDREFYNPRWSETNMVSSLACAAPWLEEAPCLVSYSDIFYDASAAMALIDCSASLAVTYDANWRSLWEKRFGDPLVDAETFRLTADSHLAEIGGRPTTVAEVEGQYMGLLRFTPAGWSEVVRIRAGLSSRERDTMHLTGTLQKVIEAGRVAVAAIPYRGAWGEVDSADDLAAYR